MDSTKVSFMAQKANIYYESGDAKTAVAEWDKALTMQPEYGFGYYRRGWFKEFAGDLEGGLEDLTIAIVLGRLGKIEIDNSRNVLKITHRK